MDHYIAREGWPFAGISIAILIIAVTIGNYFFLAATVAVSLFVLWFFRNPERVAPDGKGLVVSPADGTVVGIDRNADGLVRISIFMSVFNVHVNRIPVDGVVKKIEYNKGKFLIASRDKASFDNEQNAVTVLDACGREIKFVQIAGLVARRIVCYLREGMSVSRGTRFGMIRFGSRMDVYLPAGCVISVEKKDKVYGGTSVLASYG